MKDFAFLAGEPARREDYYIFAGVVVCGLNREVGSVR